jgi:hypothetical protein
VGGKCGQVRAKSEFEAMPEFRSQNMDTAFAKAGLLHTACQAMRSLERVGAEMSPLLSVWMGERRRRKHCLHVLSHRDQRHRRV